jgi:hypothetical protein
MLLGFLVISNTTYRKRKQERAIVDDRLEHYAGSAEPRFVDMRVILKVVVADPNGERIWRGRPKLRIVREHRIGFVWDTKARRSAGWSFSSAPLVWFASEKQAAILFERSAPAQLVEGSEGAGKTTVLAMWHFIQWVRHAGEGREGLQTAPTNMRLGLVKREIRKLWRPEWYRYATRQDFVGFELVDGSAIRMVSTHKQSAADGSPIQGFNSSWGGRDETQDQTEAHEDIESRGRAARDGVFPQLCTATVKDSAAYRNLKSKVAESHEWSVCQLLMCRSLDGTLDNIEMMTPFVAKAFVEAKKKSMSAREFRRRYFAEDLMPELAVYYEWLRTRNLQPLPNIGAFNVTPQILAPYQSYMAPGSRFSLAAGHDPGVIYNTSVVARLMVVGGLPQWRVVGEFQTKQTSAIDHARQFREYLAKTFDVERRIRDRSGNLRPDPESSKVATFVDPHGRGEGKTDYQTVYGAFQAVGMDVFNPAPHNGFVKRSARVDMLNRLLGGTAAQQGVPRLVVNENAPGEPAAPVLVRSFEQLVKRPGDENPEGFQRKDETDMTHAPSALAYLLWSFEQQHITEHTVKAARAAAGVRA